MNNIVKAQISLRTKMGGRYVKKKTLTTPPPRPVCPRVWPVGAGIAPGAAGGSDGLAVPPGVTAVLSAGVCTTKNSSGSGCG